MLTLLSMLCACFVANPQAVVKTMAASFAPCRNAKDFCSNCFSTVEEHYPMYRAHEFHR